MKGWALAGIFAILLALSVAYPRQREQAEDPRIAMWQAKYAEASTTVRVRVDTVRVRVAALRTFRDTLRLTDTVQVKLYLDRADSTVKSCLDLADSCEAQRRASDFLIDGLQRENAGMRKRHARQKFTSRFGLFVGYGAQRMEDGALRGGWQVGLGVRVLP